MFQTPVVQRALELADSGRFRIPSEVRRALVNEGYSQSDAFGIEGKATWALLRERCAKAVMGSSLPSGV